MRFKKMSVSNLKWWMSVLKTNIQWRFHSSTAGNLTSLNNIWWYIVQGTFLLLWVWLALPGNRVAKGTIFFGTACSSDRSKFQLRVWNKQGDIMRLRFLPDLSPSFETCKKASSNRNWVSDAMPYSYFLPFPLHSYPSVHLFGCPHGARCRHWPLSAWLSPWWCQNPCPAAGTALRPATPPQRSPPCCSSGLLCPAGPAASRGWTGSDRWVLRCENQRRWSPRVWCSTLEGPGRTRASQSW